MKRPFFLAFILLASGALNAAEWTPAVRLAGLGGQFFYEDQTTSFSGNGDWLLGGSGRLSEKTSVLGTVSGRYRRVREVQELIGGGFLTRETLENGGTAKIIRTLGESWKLKGKASYKNIMLVESEDEKLSKGLYDYHKIGAGLEAERTGGRLRSLSISLDPYAVRFYHYSSLASGSQFGSEINSGDHTLDFNAYDFSSAAEYLLAERTLLTGSALLSYRPYPDQKIVQVSGTYAGSNRSDLYGQAGLGIFQGLPAWPLLRLESGAGFDATYIGLRSNQNNYDASRTRFNPDYYDYDEYHVSPRVSSRWFGKLSLSLAYDYSRRNYRERPLQNEDGTYGSDRIVLHTQSVSCSLSYPLPKGFSIVAEGVYRNAYSNMQYQKSYRYNYHAEHYFAGIAWEY
jgi:hypothetical protein